MKTIYEHIIMRDNDCKPYLEKEKSIKVNDKIESYDEMVKLMNSKFKMNKLGTENCYVIAFTYSLEPIGIIHLSSGTSLACEINNRELFMSLLLLGAEQFVVFHNHVNGTTEISGNDYLVTENIKHGASLLGIRFLEHIVIGRNGYNFIR